ncbi:DUF992 domain-containing protein [Oceanicella sp. SM1341]|uniref:DUF992 domain-containing protein n=1 Tax=Oceanicella sp. SM1341 TaxID=1548889 RepID=UPI0013009AA2|nr:DUF992 domain-containing protein [Oceanicella sp. SM1341]
MKRSGLLVASLLAASGLGAVAAQADEPAKIDVGVLTCDLTGKSNIVVLSNSQYVCTLDGKDDAWDQVYVGDIDKIGIDLNAVSQQTIKWGVLTTSGEYNPQMMEGTYVGASADAALGLGAGAKVLVGGSGDAISLQPLSVSGQEGIGIAAGLERMTLTKVGEKTEG